MTDNVRPISDEEIIDSYIRKTHCIERYFNGGCGSCVRLGECDTVEFYVAKLLKRQQAEIKTAKADAIKEFAEQLKNKVLYEKARNYEGNNLATGYNAGIDIAIDILGDLVEEMVGDTDG